MITYNTFLESKDSLSFQAAEEIYNQMLQYANFRDPDFQEYWDEMIKTAVTYTSTRADWHFVSLQERNEKDLDASRTRQHNDFMHYVKVIARYMSQNNLNTDWFAQLGDPVRDRKRFGDFACYLTYIYSLNAR